MSDILNVDGKSERISGYLRSFRLIHITEVEVRELFVMTSGTPIYPLWGILTLHPH